MSNHLFSFGFLLGFPHWNSLKLGGSKSPPRMSGPYLLQLLKIFQDLKSEVWILKFWGLFFLKCWCWFLALHHCFFVLESLVNIKLGTEVAGLICPDIERQEVNGDLSLFWFRSGDNYCHTHPPDFKRRRQQVGRYPPDPCGPEWPLFVALLSGAQMDGKVVDAQKDSCMVGGCMGCKRFCL